MKVKDELEREEIKLGGCDKGRRGSYKEEEEEEEAEEEEDKEESEI